MTRPSQAPESAVNGPVGGDGGSPPVRTGLDRRGSYRGWVRTIISIRATPRQIALGVAVGSFIAFTPLMGIQTLLAALAATLLGASRKAAMLAVWISNPVTMGPIFAATYQLGRALEDKVFEPDVFVKPWSGHVLTVGGSLRNPYLIELIETSGSIIGPMFLGGAVLGLLAALAAYQLTHKGVAAYQESWEQGSKPVS